MKRSTALSATERARKRLPQPNRYRRFFVTCAVFGFFGMVATLVYGVVQTLAVYSMPKSDVVRLFSDVFPSLKDDPLAVDKVAFFGFLPVLTVALHIGLASLFLHRLYSGNYISARQSQKLVVAATTLSGSFVLSWMLIAGAQLSVVGPATTAPPQLAWMNEWLSQDISSMFYSAAAFAVILMLIFAGLLTLLRSVWQAIDRRAQEGMLEAVPIYLGATDPEAPTAEEIGETVHAVAHQLNPERRGQLVNRLYQDKLLFTTESFITTGLPLQDARLSGTEAPRIDLGHTRLDGADLSKGDYRAASFTRATLDGASLVDADLQRAKMVGASLRRAVLRGADVAGADFHEADLSFADFTGTNLTYRQMTSAGARRGIMIDEMAQTPPHWAFISHHKDSDGTLALKVKERLEALLERVQDERLGQGRRVFVDREGILVGEGLGTKLDAAVNQAEFLILLARPESARSEWVAREIHSWRSGEHSRPSRFLIILTGGTLKWDDRTNDWDYDLPNCALAPEMLRGYFGTQPRYIDLSQDKKNDPNHVDAELRSILSTFLRLDPDLVDKKSSSELGEIE